LQKFDCQKKYQKVPKEMPRNKRRRTDDEVIRICKLASPKPTQKRGREAKGEEGEGEEWKEKKGNEKRRNEKRGKEKRRRGERRRERR
jgi:hypothetical protein